MSYAVYLEGRRREVLGRVHRGCAVRRRHRPHRPARPEKTGENAGILYDSIHRKIAPLGDQALLFPAHGSGSACGGNISDRDDSTLGIEKGTNPVFKKSRKEFVEHKLAEKMPRPPYFTHMEEVNLLAGRPLQVAAGRLVCCSRRNFRSE